MGRSNDESLKRIGRAAYKDIVVPRKRAPIPARFQHKAVNTRTYEGLEFAREPLGTREFYSTITARSRVKALQHIVASRTDELLEAGKPMPPWQYRVTARCKAKLRRAAVKAGRQFLELDVCPKCWKTVTAE